MSNFPIADMLTMLRNANSKYLEKIDVPGSKLLEEIVRVLKQEGYITSYKRIDDYKQGVLRIYLKYGQNKERVITEIKCISKPGLRIYRGCSKIPRVYGGLGVAIVSTPKGIMTDREARKQKLGGEVICTVW